jgi:hydroxymethylpyrimidine/phosphomethylpyrimidine kinase
MKKILTIAGSDCSGGAGIQADLKTIMAHQCYGMSVITALTAQNTTGVYGISVVSSEFVKQQLECIFKDIFPDAIKIGMVVNFDIIDVIVNQIKKYEPKNIVLDPVMVSTSGSQLLSDDAIEALTSKLMPLADLITPNIPEAEKICGFSINSHEGMLTAGHIICEKTGTPILIKGGHLIECADDLLVDNTNDYWFKGSKINNPNTHGTGCTLSSSIAAHLALGNSMAESIEKAKAYISGALESGFDLGKGSGPLNHGYLFEK